mmetsp:Transcript_19930/g.46370  ORF Transcript_19930/g.46370 Transcript_19930/m.46370 type:complete len:521 (+) Transcript_19930:73-1635(+)
MTEVTPQPCSILDDPYSQVGDIDMELDETTLRMETFEDEQTTLCQLGPAQDDYCAPDTEGDENLNDAASASSMDDEELQGRLVLSSLLAPTTSSSAERPLSPQVVISLAAEPSPEGGPDTEGSQGTVQGDEAPASSSRVCGVVVKFAPKRGFGVIAPEDGGGSVFAHWTQIYSEDKWPQLFCGMRVEYTPSVSDGKVVATTITAPGGGVLHNPEETMRRQRELSTDTYTGKVAWFHAAGYGFILTDVEIEWPEKLPAGSSIYVSREDLVMAEGSIYNLEPGMPVQFRVFKPEGKAVTAAEVTAIGGDPLVCSATAPALKQLSGKIGTTMLKRCAGLKPGASTPSGGRIEGVKRTMLKPKVQIGTTQAVSLMMPPCKFFLQGRCNKGTACPYRHSVPAETFDPAELDRSLDAALGSLRSRGGQRLADGYETADAQDAAGADVEIAQEAADASPAREAPSPPRSLLTPGQPLLRPQNEPTIPIPCKFFAQGCCLKGESCKFAHIRVEDALTACLVESINSLR